MGGSPGIKKTTRSSGACLACRARKHKCSGQRPKCAQCGFNNVRCQWPEQRKRGPPKHYITTMEKRLMDTENILCALISQVSDSQLLSALGDRNQNNGQPSDIDELPVGGSFFDLIKGHKFGPVYWANHPLNSAENVKRWCADRASIIPTDDSLQQSPRVEVAFGEPQTTTQSEGENDGDDPEESEITVHTDWMTSAGDRSTVCELSTASPQCVPTYEATPPATATASGSPIQETTMTSTHLEKQTLRWTGAGSQAPNSYESAFLW